MSVCVCEREKERGGFQQWACGWQSILGWDVGTSASFRNCPCVGTEIKPSVCMCEITCVCVCACVFLFPYYIYVCCSPHTRTCYAHTPLLCFTQELNWIGELYAHAETHVFIKRSMWWFGTITPVWTKGLKYVMAVCNTSYDIETINKWVLLDTCR